VQEKRTSEFSESTSHYEQIQSLSKVGPSRARCGSG
jgi:hypothetical protein